MDTIFALSSGSPPAAIAVVRISGPNAFSAVTHLAGDRPAPRVATLRTLRDGEVELDRALVLIFPGPHSATGEDLAELHLHGGRAVVRAVERALAGRPGLRPAEPGEFTRRALLHGRIDLTEAEGLGDLLTAETEHQRRMALATSQGVLSRLIDRWRDRLLALAAQLEAEIDFSDEDDVRPGQIETLRSGSAALASDMRQALATPPVERLRDGLRIVIAGPPNSGKSTLLNAMADREAAIVSPISGTTRDRIEVPVVRNGVAYLLTDTAGLADATEDPIEAIGMTLTTDAIRAADLVIWLGDTSAPEGALWVHARSDLPGRETMPVGPSIMLAAARGTGIAALWDEIGRRSAKLLPPADAIALNRRQRDLIAEAAEMLVIATSEHDPLIVAERFRCALAAFDRLTGQADVEALLDTLFGRFCIGK